MYWRAILIVALGAACGLTPRRAVAVCTPAALQDAVGLQLTQPAVAALGGPLATLIPTRFALPDTQTPLFDCFIEEARLETRRGELELEIDRLDLHLEDGAVRVELAGDLRARVHFDAYVCELLDQSCDGEVTAQRVLVTGRVRPTVAACEARFPTEDLQIEVAPSDVVAQLDACGLYGEVWDIVQSVAKEQVLDLVREELAEYLTELIPGYLASLTTEAIDQDMELSGVHLRIEPQAMQVTPTRWTLAFRGAAAPGKTSGSCLPEGTLLPPVPASTHALALPAGMAAVGVSEAFTQQVLSAAWYAGWLCFDSREAGLDLSGWLQSTIPGGELSAQFVPEAPPVLDFAPGGGEGARLSLQAARADVLLSLPDGAEHHASASAGLAMELAVALDPATHALEVTPLDAALVDTTVQLGDNVLGLSADGVRGFLDTVVMPALRDELSTLPLVSGLFATAPLAVVVDSTAIQGDAVVASLSLIPIDADDGVPPSTAVVTAPACPCGPTLELTMGSVDDTTPAGLLRHVVTVDGAAQAPVSAGTAVRLSGLAGGHKLIELSAVDLAGNTDPTPVHIELDVDDVEPTVEIVDAPVGIVDATEAELRVRPSDDHDGALTLRYEVGSVSRDNEPDTVLARGGVRGELLRLTELPDGATVRVTITATDHAGNEGSAQATFAVVLSPTMGCAATESALGCLAALTLLRRRRRR